MELNPKQQEAADFIYGTACVIAVPGSGKTGTMTYRIGNLVNHHGIAPENILGLTFTRNAAQAMRERLKPILDELSSRVTLCTIHSFCMNLLKTEGMVFQIIQGTEQIQLIREIMSKMKIKNLPAGMVLREIGLAGNNMIMPEEFKLIYEGDDTMQVIGNVYETYAGEKQKRRVKDFTDLLTDTQMLLQTDHEVREKYQSMYSHIMVDEYQDTNPVQKELLTLLSEGRNGGKHSFWICGDDWQSIYAFTGASLGNILKFTEMYPDAKRFILDINYRSTPQILDVCKKLVSHNIRKIEKNLNTINPDGDNVVLIEASNEEDESNRIIAEIRKLTGDHGYAFKDIAILYRANNQSRIIEDMFTQNDIPYQIENGISFYQRYEVKILLDYLRLIVKPSSLQGNEALKNVINVPNRYLGRNFVAELEGWSRRKSLYMYDGLKTMSVNIPYMRKGVDALVNLIDPLIDRAVVLQPARLITILREELNYDKYISDDDVPGPDDSKTANIDQLVEAAARYHNIEALLNYTDSFREKKTRDKNGVSLMTVHKSKGLEFPAVFVIGFIDGVLPNKNGDIEEERRIAFVGLSRAMKQLYVSYPLSYSGRPADRSPFIDEMFENL